MKKVHYMCKLLSQLAKRQRGGPIPLGLLVAQDKSAAKREKTADEKRRQLIKGLDLSYLSGEDAEKVRAILLNHIKVISDGETFGQTDRVKHSIDTGSATPIAARAYHVVLRQATVFA